MVKEKVVVIETYRVGPKTTKTNDKPIRRKLYKDQYGYYIKQGKTWFPTATQKEDGSWEITRTMTLEVARYREKNHTEDNAVKA